MLIHFLEVQEYMHPYLVKPPDLQDLVPGGNAAGPSHGLVDAVSVRHVCHHLSHHLLRLALDALHPGPLVDQEGGEAVVEPGDVPDQ